MRAIITMICAVALIVTFTTQSPADAKTFRWGYQGDAAEMDYQARRETFTDAVIANMMEGMIRYNGKLELEPSLAEKWELLSPTVWRFFLRRGVKFHNGNPFNADDVIATFKRGSDKRSPWKGSLFPVKEMRKVDDYTVDVETHGPYPILLRDLSNMMIFDNEWLVEHNAMDPVDPGKQEEGYTIRHINGTGPFILETFKPDDRTIMKANPDWWDNPNKVHNLTKVIFRPIKSDATRVAALLSGELDMIYPVPLQDMNRINKAQGYSVLEAPALRTLFFGMNMSGPELRTSTVKGKNPLSDIRVRKAIYQAIDINTIRKKVMRGHSDIVSVIISRNLGGFHPSMDGRLLPFDPEASKRLLSDAGYPDGFDIELVCPNDRYINDEDICVASVSMLAKAGIKVKLNSMPKAKWGPYVRLGKADFWMLGWASSTTMDAQNALVALVHSSDGKRGAFNQNGYSNPKVDNLIKKIDSETDPEKRQALINEAFKYHKEEIGAIPIHSQTLVWGIKEGVKLEQPANNVLMLRYVQMP
jgi:peptide/nickel transport system substrate-binding protein